MTDKDEPDQTEEIVGENKELEVDNKGNVLSYENSAYARPRTRGRMRSDELNDRTSGHE